MRVTWKAALYALLMTSPIAASAADDAPQECLRDETTFACAVAKQTWQSLAVFLDAIEASDDAKAAYSPPLMFYPRLVAAEGWPEKAISAAIPFLPDDPTILANWRFSGMFGDLRRTLRATANDPLPPLSAETLESLNDADLERAGPWAMVLAARAWAAAGDETRARATFLAAAQASLDMASSVPGRLGKIDEMIFVQWAAAGFSDDALAFVAEWSEVDAAYAALSVAEGVALTGDIEATRSMVRSLRGVLPLLGGLVVAEAERRAGDPDASHATLDATVAALEEQRSSWLLSKSRVRLAQAYAALGDFEAMREAAGWSGREGFAYYDYWPDIAPFVACHDLNLALELLVPPERTTQFDFAEPEPWHAADVLLSAAASGQGEAAYAVARDTPNPGNRTLLMMAVLTGLAMQDARAPHAPGCTFPLASLN